MPTMQRRSDICFPRNETARTCSQFLHPCVCQRFIYLGSVHLFFNADPDPDPAPFSSWSGALAVRIHDVGIGNICFDFSVLCLCSAGIEL
jgi:hypothetical protein